MQQNEYETQINTQSNGYAIECMKHKAIKNERRMRNEASRMKDK